MEAVQPASPAERREALSLLVRRPELARSEQARQVEDLLLYADRCRFSLENCLTVRQDGRNITTCLLVDSPGRTSSVFLPATTAGLDAELTWLLTEATQRARQRNIQLLQAMVAPEATHEATILRGAGFEILAHLIYLENDLNQPILPARAIPAVEWRSYSEQARRVFEETILGTYQGSLDCGSLNGRRCIEDIMASHRATGVFAPSLWLLGQVRGQPVGVSLLARVPDACTLEVVYMGLLPEWRGRGYGSTLLKKTLELAAGEAVAAVSLSVDDRNLPARRLYERFGFIEQCRRDAWIRILS